MVGGTIAGGGRSFVRSGHGDFDQLGSVVRSRHLVRVSAARWRDPATSFRVAARAVARPVRGRDRVQPTLERPLAITRMSGVQGHPARP